jgi:hypothetical protein
MQNTARTRSFLGLCLFACSASGCAGTLAGYPHYYQDTNAVLKVDQPYLAADVREKADSADASQRGGRTPEQYRNAVVAARMEVIDNFYYKFEAELSGTYNGTALTADLTTLILNGLGATLGGAETKAALAAASAGVVGAKGSISTDLFYSKTAPAIIALMKADRLKVKAQIQAGLANPINKYSFASALSDVDLYFIAGTVPDAISQITANAGVTSADAAAAIDKLRAIKYAAPSASGKQIIAWLFPGGDQIKPPVAANLAVLNKWMSGYTADPVVQEIPYELFLLDASLEGDRARAIKDLKIP